MTSNRKTLISEMLKGIETGDPSVVAVVNEEKYIQHNPQTHEGSEGLAALFKRLSKTSPRVNIVRVFEDDRAVEHWDNIQKRHGPNNSGHSMVDGTTEVIDHEMTERNRKTIQNFIEEVLINGHLDKMAKYIHQGRFIEHNPRLDSLDQLFAILSHSTINDTDSIHYKKCHRLLAEGNFVLSVCEGTFNQTPFSFFDLFRLDKGKIVEHWDTTEAIPPKEKWKNNNGKF